MLKVREDHVASVLEECRRRLGEVTRDPARYSEVLLALITQGLLQVRRRSGLREYTGSLS